ncbi:MAG: hypothetical protein JST31_09240 [Actinobacteria bacterium]|nr:hypothetical protein [Actinomycetota bacterium]
MTAVDAQREVTPALVRGRRGSVTVLREGELAPGLEGQLCHHVFCDGIGDRDSTVVLTAIPEGVAFAPALVCRDREELGGGAPAQLPSERWERIELESTAFNRRYRLLSLSGQDAVYARELFSPALIAWLAHDVPAGFSFELNERFLLVALPGHLGAGEDLDRLCALAAELARRIREEAAEEGEGSGLFDEAEKLAEIEKNLARVRFEQPPASVGIAFEAFRAAARWRPTVLLRGAFWGLLGFAVMAIPVTLVSNPFFGFVAGAVAAYLAFYVAWVLASADYRWGGAASVRRLGLEAFLRGYASSRGLREENRWRFHSVHRNLPLPGTVAHVMAGPIPGSDRDGATVVIWHPVAGSMCFGAREFDQFRAAAGELLAQVGEDGEDAAVAAVAAAEV